MKMTQAELNVVLELHKKWLDDEEGGVRANLSNADLSRANLSNANLSRANLSNADLSGADLSRANLRGADLRGTTLDFSCLPLWCGSLNMIIDERLEKQILYHLISIAPDKEKYRDLLAFANESHVVTEYNCKRIAL